MIAQIRAELLKQRTVRTPPALFLTLVGLVTVAVVLHGVGLPLDMLAAPHSQLMVVGVGERLGVLFAALFGTMTVTSEFRHGTIRATLLVAPRRWRVTLAKVVVAILVGTAFGLGATLLATAVGTGMLTSRGLVIGLTGDDLRVLVLGSAVAGGGWGAIGVGVGAIVRNQVPTLIGLSAWLLFVEGLFIEESSSVVQVGKFGPGAAAAALSGLGGSTLLAPAAGVIVIALYAVGATVAGTLSMARRDIS